MRSLTTNEEKKRGGSLLVLRRGQTFARREKKTRSRDKKSWKMEVTILDRLDMMPPSEWLCFLGTCRRCGELASRIWDMAAKDVEWVAKLANGYERRARVGRPVFDVSRLDFGTHALPMVRALVREFLLRRLTLTEPRLLVAGSFALHEFLHRNKSSPPTWRPQDIDAWLHCHYRLNHHLDIEINFFDVCRAFEERVYGDLRLRLLHQRTHHHRYDINMFGYNEFLDQEDALL